METRMDIVEKGLQFAPQNENLLLQLVRLSRFPAAGAQKAREAMARILAEGKSAGVIHFALGVDAWERGKPELAREHYALAYEAAPQMPDVANNMAMILAIGPKPDLPQALAIIQSVLKRLPDNPNYRETRGQILVRMARWPEAVADLEFALPSLASRTRTHSALAEAYTNLGSKELADQHSRLAKEVGQPPRSAGL
jgi:Flp pilus assembly protein TadD